MGLICPILFGPLLEPRARHPLAEAALLEKIFLKPRNLAVDEVVGLVDQADCDVGDHFGRARLENLAVKLVGLRLFRAEASHVKGFFEALSQIGRSRLRR